MNSNMTISNLTLGKERRLFWILAAFSAIIWLAVIVSIVGIAVAAIALLVGFFANGLFTARIRSESVEVTQNQMPELYEIFVAACAKLEMSSIPRLYIMQEGGWLNAFATRFSRRNFVVLYSDLVEAFEPNSKELQFIIGHELGHIKQKHLTKDAFVIPGMLMPLLGSAYSRARESTCDRYGAFVADDITASMRAALALAGGKQLYRIMDPNAFAHQHVTERGFFISLHELLSSYPTMSKRASDIKAFGENTPAPRVSRNPFAYVAALFAVNFATYISMCVIFVASYALSHVNVAKIIQSLQTQSPTEQVATSTPAELHGLWVSEDGRAGVLMSEEGISSISRCLGEEIVRANSPVTFISSYFIIQKSDSQKKVIEGQECSAELQAGAVAYKLEGNDCLILGEGDQRTIYKKVLLD